MSTTTIKVFGSNDSNSGTNAPPLNYFNQSLQSIFDSFHTTEDLILWIIVVISIAVGFLLNLLVIRSILRVKCNGKCRIKPL